MSTSFSPPPPPSIGILATLFTPSCTIFLISLSRINFSFFMGRFNLLDPNTHTHIYNRRKGRVGERRQGGGAKYKLRKVQTKSILDMNVIRFPFLWERVQPTLEGPLDPYYSGQIDLVVQYITVTKGMYPRRRVGPG